MIITSGVAWNEARATSPEDSDAIERPAIVLVAFGTSNPEARKVFDHIDAAARRRYPKHDIHWAFTSDFILKKLKRQGIEVKSLHEVVDDLKHAGHTSAVFQSLHVAPGQEHEEIRKVDTSGLRIAIGSALLTDDDDIEAVIAALAGEIKKDAANVVVCHGNRRHPEFNRQLVALAETIEARYGNVVVCSINGQPGTDKLAKARREAAHSGSVHFIPMMVVAGVHVAEDVLGDNDDSWRNVVGAAKTTCAKPLGYRNKVLAVYFQHLDEALAEVKKQAHVGDRR
jgi:sirohydrochlorin cobaltochelatase